MQITERDENIAKLQSDLRRIEDELKQAESKVRCPA